MKLFIENDETRKRIDKRGDDLYWETPLFKDAGVIMIAPPIPVIESGATQIIPRIDCEHYALGRMGVKRWLLDFPELDKPERGDIVFYCEEREYMEILHLAVYQKDGIVISRWGCGGPVLKHPMNFVPTSYGDFVIFRRVTKNDIKKLPSYSNT